MYMDDYRDGTFVCESVRLRRPLVATRPSAEPTPRPATQNHYNPSITRPHSLSTCRPLEPAVAEGLSARRCRRRRPRRRSDSSESPPRTRPRPRPRHAPPPRRCCSNECFRGTGASAGCCLPLPLPCLGSRCRSSSAVGSRPPPPSPPPPPLLPWSYLPPCWPWWQGFVWRPPACCPRSSRPSRAPPTCSRTRQHHSDTTVYNIILYGEFGESLMEYMYIVWCQNDSNVGG